MTGIKATLQADIEFTDTSGTSHRLRKGDEVEVFVGKPLMTSTDFEGRTSAVSEEEFYAHKNGHTFDIDRSEFKAID